MSDPNTSNDNGPVITGAIMFAFVVVGSTLLWVLARPAVALLYGFMRSVELPFLNGLLPHGSEFHLSTLRRGHMPGVWTIYKNSLFYGMFWFTMTFILMFVAISRVSDNAISKFVNIKSKFGHSVRDVLERYATNHAPVRFFNDYDVISLPTEIGTARQSFTALETLLYADVIQSISLDPIGGERPKLNIDEDRMAAWYKARFGKANPFTNRSLLPNPRLMDIDDIERAVDDLSWPSVLILAPAVKRIISFYSEKTSKGLETSNRQIEEFIEGVWKEINTFKQEFGDSITLGAANDWDKAEQIARHANARRAKGGKSKGDDASSTIYEPYISTDAKSSIQRIYETGQIARGEVASGITIDPVMVGPQPNKITPTDPERLLFFGEVLAQRGPTLKSVIEGRAILKDYLTRHLGMQREQYPVGIDPKTELMRFAKTIADGEQQAFNQQAQERLNTGAQAIERCLFRHGYEFGAVGSALDKARESGIMPPSLFRYLRFCDDTQSIWWFVHNLGMPSAVPENAGLFEHYQAERLAGIGLSKPYIRSAIDGLKTEAEKYLTNETVHELNRVLGGNALKRVTHDLRGKLHEVIRDTPDSGELNAIGAFSAQIASDYARQRADDKAKDQGKAAAATHDNRADALSASTGNGKPDITLVAGRKPQTTPPDRRAGTASFPITTDKHDLAERVAQEDDSEGGIANIEALMTRMTTNATGMQVQRIRQLKAERDHDAKQSTNETADDSDG